MPSNPDRLGSGWKRSRRRRIWLRAGNLDYGRQKSWLRDDKSSFCSEVPFHCRSRSVIIAARRGPCRSCLRTYYLRYLWLIPLFSASIQLIPVTISDIQSKYASEWEINSVIEILRGDSLVVLVDISDNSTLPVRNLFTVSLIVIHSRVVLWPIFVTAICRIYSCNTHLGVKISTLLYHVSIDIWVAETGYRVVTPYRRREINVRKGGCSKKWASPPFWHFGPLWKKTSRLGG